MRRMSFYGVLGDYGILGIREGFRSIAFGVGVHEAFDTQNFSYYGKVMQNIENTFVQT